MRRVVRLEPGHRWNGKYAYLPDDQWSLLTPVLVRPIVADWTNWTDVAIATIDTAYETQRWSVERLPTEVARWYRSDFGLLGPAMRLLAVTGSWPQPIQGVW